MVAGIIHRLSSIVQFVWVNIDMYLFFLKLSVTRFTMCPFTVRDPH